MSNLKKTAKVTARLATAASAGFLAAALGSATPAPAAVQMVQEVSIVPLPVDTSGNLNPTFVTWNQNALSALQSGASSFGDTTGPSGYQSTTAVSRQDYFSTAGDASASPLPGSSPFFPSWRGQADPGGAYNSEHGSALFFPLRILGNGQKIEIANLSNVMTSNDPADIWAATGTGLANGNNYSFFRVGIVYGPSGKPGPGETIVSSGPGTTPVDEIDYTGIGIWQTASSSYGGSHQNMIDQSVAAFYKQYPMSQITNAYTLTDGSGGVLAENTSTVNFVPEPSAAAVLLLPAASLLMRRRHFERFGA